MSRLLSFLQRHTPLSVFLFSLAVSLLTMQRTVSFWDCGEFIATSFTLGVSHPPGAPLYQLLAHLFTLMAWQPAHIAWWSNLLSALVAALTNMFLFLTLRSLLTLMQSRHVVLPALIGTLCYAFCDTAWFSAVESEVYALSMFFSSVVLWATMRWAESRNGRWMVLAAFLSGLSACVHEMGLLCLPAIVVAVVAVRWRQRSPLRPRMATLAFCVAFFILGLTPYLIVPLRAQANPTLNNTAPSNYENFLSYIRREQYENGPMLYPRIWRQHPGDADNYATWSGRHGTKTLPDGTVVYDPNLLDNLQFFATYQLGCMFLRYWVHNFGGRHYWELLYLPMLLGLIGIVRHWRRHRGSFYPLLTLCLFSGLALAVYLNMPAYQPRERDYAFVLSFYAFALWIGVGASALCEWMESRRLKPAIVLAVPLLMLAVNYPHNNRSHNTAAYDVAHNILYSCEPNAILFTTGDNDTYPLWYLQEAEGIRKDVTIINVSLLTTRWYAQQMAPGYTNLQGEQLRGYRAVFALINNNIASRPIYMTHYTHHDYAPLYPNQLQLSGNAYRLQPTTCDSVALDEAARHAIDHLQWRTRTTAQSDITERRFHQRYLADMTLIADRLDAAGRHAQADSVRARMVGR